RMSAGSTRASAAIARTVAASNPTLANRVRADARIFALVRPGPGRLPVRGTCPQAAEPQEDDAQSQPCREHDDRPASPRAAEVEGAAHAAVQRAGRHPRGDGTVEI